jgi:hypothetical protein
VACLALNATVALYALACHPALNSDFIAFWSFPRFAPARLYDAGALEAFQQALYPGFHSFYPFLYPPTLLLVIAWLAWLPFGAAQLVWTVAGLAALVAAGLWFFPGRRFAVVAMLGCPAALITGATGETAFFTTALLLAGFAALPGRPLLAGVFFGLLTLKPQLGVLVPFALLGLGAWRAMLAAGLTALALVALSCLVFPAGMWMAWLHALPAYQADYFADVHRLNLNILVTPAADALLLGVGPRFAWALQVVCGVALAGATFAAFRWAPYRPAVALLCIGMFLAVPHAYAYDTVPLTAALAVLWRPGWSFGVLAGLIYLGPFLLLSPASAIFLYALPESVLYAVAVRLVFVTFRREFRERPKQ